MNKLAYNSHALARFIIDFKVVPVSVLIVGFAT